MKNNIRINLDTKDTILLEFLKLPSTEQTIEKQILNKYGNNAKEIILKNGFFKREVVINNKAYEVKYCFEIWSRYQADGKKFTFYEVDNITIEERYI